MAPDGGLMEGLSSNFFVLLGGKLVTAEEGVLSGTVRELVLQVAAHRRHPWAPGRPPVHDRVLVLRRPTGTGAFGGRPRLWAGHAAAMKRACSG
jgi:hypothetical protein